MLSRSMFYVYCRAAIVLLASACAALGTRGAGDRDLPSAGVGPFRKLDGDELLGIAPFVLDGRVARYREPSILPLDPHATEAPANTRVALFAVGLAGEDAGARDVIVRSRADDARSFFGTSSDNGHAPMVVLRADATWEGDRIGAPSAVWIGGKVFLYYAGATGIGLARSDDGLAFRKESAPVLVQSASSAWETTPPSAPSVAVYPDGKIRMLYAAGNAIGEAESDDGIVWRRISDAPVIVPSAMPDPASLLPGEKPPFDTQRVSDPCLAPRMTPAGRLHVRVLYTGYDGAGGTAIGFAARYGDTGPLSKQATPVFAVGKKEAAPALFEWSAGSLLYVHQDRPGDMGTTYPAIAAAYAPVNLRLAAALSFPDGP